jgi:hypothetical protein
MSPSPSTSGDRWLPARERSLWRSREALAACLHNVFVIVDHGTGLGFLVFLVDEATGNPIYAITQNEAYVEYAKKRNPPPEPPPPPPSDCCERCRRLGGESCYTYPDGSCFCVGIDAESTDGLDSIPPPGI